MRLLVLLIFTGLSHEASIPNQPKIAATSPISENADSQNQKPLEIISLSSYDSTKPLIIRSKVQDAPKPSETDLEYEGMIIFDRESKGHLKNTLLNSRGSLQANSQLPSKSSPIPSLPLSESNYEGYLLNMGQDSELNVFPTINAESLSDFTSLLNSESSFGIVGLMALEAKQSDDHQLPKSQQQKESDSLDLVPEQSHFNMVGSTYDENNQTGVSTQNKSSNGKSSSRSTKRSAYTIEQVPELATFTKLGPFSQSDIPSFLEIQAVFNKVKQNTHKDNKELTTSQLIEERSGFSRSNTQNALLKENVSSVINKRVKSPVRGNIITQTTQQAATNQLINIGHNNVRKFSTVNSVLTNSANGAKYNSNMVTMPEKLKKMFAIRTNTFISTEAPKPQSITQSNPVFKENSNSVSTIKIKDDNIYKDAVSIHFRNATIRKNYQALEPTPRIRTQSVPALFRADIPASSEVELSEEEKAAAPEEEEKEGGREEEQEEVTDQFTIIVNDENRSEVSANAQIEKDLSNRKNSIDIPIFSGLNEKESNQSELSSDEKPALVRERNNNSIDNTGKSLAENSTLTQKISEALTNQLMSFKLNIDKEYSTINNILAEEVEQQPFVINSKTFITAETTTIESVFQNNLLFKENANNISSVIKDDKAYKDEASIDLTSATIPTILKQESYNELENNRNNASSNDVSISSEKLSEEEKAAVQVKEEIGGREEEQKTVTGLPFSVIANDESRSQISTNVATGSDLSITGTAIDISTIPESNKQRGLSLDENPEPSNVLETTTSTDISNNSEIIKTILDETTISNLSLE